ncbi:MAG: DUF2339 domain-containing protein [Luteolibacter sp.]
MSNPTESEWLAAIHRLRERLEQAEIRQRMVIDELRKELSTLEKRLPVSEESSPEPVITQAAPKPLRWNEVKDRIQPPPLPPRPVDMPVETAVREEIEPEESAASFEQKLGQVWLVRIGIVLLITGLVLGGNWAYKNWIHDLPASVRLAGLYLCSALIGGSGIWLARKENLRHYGEVLLAGGLAFFYYCTYAAHHVHRLQVIESPVAAALCLLAAADLIAAVSWFRKSQGTAVMGILLASYATMIQPLDWLSSTSNLLLALTGVLLMLRPGWKSPGIASLLGTYGAFAGWQLLGASGPGGDELAALWFLPGSWAIFAIPGMLGRFREALGDRGRTHFTVANNGLFFALFSWMWLSHYGGTDYWAVAAVFGSILLAMGVAGRKLSDDAAASNVMQGLAFLSLALVLKLDGYHLRLALAGESLALALAFHRFRKRAEFAFSLLAGTAAALMALDLHDKSPDIPAWSGLLAAVLVGMAAVILRFNVDQSERPTPAVVRSGTSVLCYSSLAILLLGWCYHLDEAWQLPVTMGLAALFSVVAVRWDRDDWLPEIGRASGIAGLFAGLLMVSTQTPWRGYGFTIASAVVACAAWHSSASKRESLTSAFAWLFAVLAPVACIQILGQWYPDLPPQVMPLAVSSVGLVVIARWAGAYRLEITGCVLNVIALGLIGTDLLRAEPVISQAISFVPAAAALVTLRVIRFNRDPGARLQEIITASCLFIAWPAAILNAVPQHAIDLMAISAGMGFFLAMKRDEAAPVYCWGWTLVSLVAYGIMLLGGPSSTLHSHQFEGFALVLLLVGIAMKRPRSPADLPASALSWLACVVLSVWTTHITVDYFGWKAASVVWTVLGFAMVSFGLMVNRVTSRQAGFLLLSLALLKLFFMDVWDFTTFLRVVSFIALGLALVVLGLFYHRFAPALKRLIEVDESKKPQDEVPHSS